MASAVLATISRDEVERARLTSEFKYEMDTKSRINTAKWEGREEGRAEGIEVGLKKGMEKGMEKGRVEVAKNLKTNGVAVETIARSTGLSAEEIARL